MSNSEWVDDDHEWEDDRTHESTSPVVSGVRNFVQGASAGFSDELAGLVEGAGRAAGLNGLGGPMKDISRSPDGATLDWEILKDAYHRAREKERGSLKKDIEENPGASTAGNIAGMLVSPVNKVGKSLSLAKSGAAIGGLNALGSSDAEDVGGMLEDTAIGAGTGLVIGKGVDKMSPLIQKGAEKVSQGSRNLAERFGARTLGAERGSIKSLGIDKVRKAGAQALDEGVLSPLASTDDLVSRNAALKTKGGKMMGEAYQAIDDAGASTFNPLDVASKVDDELGGFYRSPINRGETNQLENTLESILMRGEGNIPLREAQTLKEELGKVANWKNNLNITDKEKMAREAYKIVSENIDEAVKNGAGVIDRSGLTETLQQGKNLYSNAASAEKMLGNKVAREEGNKLIGLTDAITGVGALGYGGTTGDWQTAGGIMAGKKILGKYGAQNAALGLNKISKMLLKSPGMAELYSRNPQVFNKIAEKMESQLSPGLSKVAEKPDFNESNSKEALIEKAHGTKYGQAMQQAAQRGDKAVAATHFVLQQRDPEYRKLMDDENEDQE